jgi:tetratricopeptide (TPR) repeat protein/uncharacterized caspase-like protein
MRQGLRGTALLALASTSLGAQSLPPRALAGADSGARWLAVVAGITNYESVNPLRYAANDALAFRQYLLDAGIPERQIEYLPDKFATSEAITGALKKTILRARPGDSVIFYFAGHGDVEDTAFSTLEPAMLLGSNARGNNLGEGYGYEAAGALRVYELKGMFDKLTTHKRVTVIAIVDACHSGHFFDNRSRVADWVTQGLQGATTLVLLSTKPGSLSREDEKWGGGHGVFTWYLLEGLRSGLVSLFDLLNYVRPRVLADTRGMQTPWFPSDLEPHLPRILPARPGPGGGPDAARAPAPHVLRALATLPAPLDTAVERQVSAFRDALLGRRLLEPSQGSAWEILGRLRAMRTARDVVPELEIDLQTALQSKASEVITAYLESPDRLPHASRFRLAERELRGALQLFERDDPTAPQVHARAQFLGAYASIREGNRSQYQRAEDSLRLAFRHIPRAAYVVNALGVVHLRTDRQKDAEAEFARAIQLSPNWVLPRINLGNAIFNQGRHAEAILRYREAIEVDSLNSDIYGNLGSLYLNLGRYLEAEQYLRRSIALDPENSFAYRRLGTLYRTKRQFQRAEAVLDTAVAVASSDPGGRYEYGAAIDRALLYSGTREADGGGDYAKAREALRPALELAPFEPSPLAHLGDLLRYQGKPDSAEAAYREAQRLDPTYEWSYQGLGLIYEGRKQWDRAASVIKQVLERGYYPPTAWSILASHYLRRADQDSTATRAQWEGRAEQAYGAALAADSLFAGAYSGFATLRERKSDYAGAEGWRLKILEMADSSAFAPYELGQFYVTWALADSAGRDDRYARAKTYFDLALSVDSTFTSALDARGSLAVRQSRFADAVEDFRRAATLGFAANTMSTYAASLVTAATSLYRARRMTEARAGYQAALALDPENRDARLWLARLFYLTNDPAGALSSLDSLQSRASESERRELEPLRARALLDLGRPADAAVILQRFTDPSDPVKHWRNYAALALVRLRMGDERAAIAAFRVARELDPNVSSEAFLGAEFSPPAREELVRLAARVPPA